MKDEPNILPQPQTGDYVHGIVRACLSAIPGIGSPAAEIFAIILAPPLTKRRDEWLQDLYADLKKLGERVGGFKIENLVENEAFISATFQASQIAFRTHQAEKRQALRNALMNIALGRSLDEETQFFFLGLIDAFTVTHLEILRLFSDRSAFPAQRRTELQNRRSLTDPIVLDLSLRGLLEDPRPYAARVRDSIDSLLVGRWSLSELGRKFLNFISQAESA
jgi:hypothetical protein